MYIASLAGEGVKGVDRVKGGGRASPPSASWAENTIITESMQECGHLQSMHSLVSPSSRTANDENRLEEGANDRYSLAGKFLSRFVFNFDKKNGANKTTLAYLSVPCNQDSSH
jgi:hypothetical protein